MTIFIGNIVHCTAPEILFLLPNHVLKVNSEGTICCLQPFTEFTPSAEDDVIYLSPTQFLFPGFVDTHIHAPQYPNCGIFGESTLLDWLTTYTFPLEAKYKGDDSKLAEEVYEKLIERQLQCGTTMSSYFGTSDSPSTLILAQKCQQKRVKAQIGRVCMERFCPDSLKDAKIESDIEFIDNIFALDPLSTYVWPVVTPRFAPSCEFETLQALGNLATQREIAVQTHLNENVNEIKWVAELFPNAQSYTDVYYRAKLLKHDTVLAHGVHFLDPEELLLVKTQGAGISHCPNSNASIASGIAPIKSYLDQGIKVGLGSDVSGGSTISILKNARLAILMSRLLSQQRDGDLRMNLSVTNALYLSTLGGAEVLNRQDSTGNFLVGKFFDAQLIDIAAKGSLIDVFEAAMPQTPRDRLYNLICKWLYVGDDRNTIQVWVNGVSVYSRD